jgi:hypothetical protein
MSQRKEFISLKPPAPENPIPEFIPLKPPAPTKPISKSKPISKNKQRINKLKDLVREIQFRATHETIPLRPEGTMEVMTAESGEGREKFFPFTKPERRRE